MTQFLQLLVIAAVMAALVIFGLVRHQREHAQSTENRSPSPIRLETKIVAALPCPASNYRAGRFVLQQSPVINHAPNRLQVRRYFPRSA
jgi:hypothetical protein